ncbi:MAG TPA: single-stranded-DNA-specific exonuclease RecJ [Planctomycetaceae bacterium]|nr:single-stranded-DNA-specific exonuclease RecJ [Planctomycetaceae bacterium]
MPRVWRFLPHDAALVGQVAADLRVSPLMAQVLIARKLQHQAADVLSPRLSTLYEPELLPGLSDAADRIVSAIRAGRRITIYGDYDVDGVTATALLWHCITLAGGKADYYIPSRMEEGYGINCEALRQLHQEDATRLVVSVDCGITSVAEALLARELGLELIITDHHQAGAALPEAACLVHPRLPGGAYPFGELCGVGVAFKLAWGICQRLGDGKRASPVMREFLIGAMGLAAIGTIADVVPLRGENRLIVKFGLKSLHDRDLPGLKSLLKVAQLDQKPAIEADDIAFGLAPRINAAGRLGQARLAVELLTTDKPERAAMLAAHLDELNKSRRTVELKIFKEAREQIAGRADWSEAPAVVLAADSWHPGVIGIVASRVVEQFSRPAILIAFNGQAATGQGSGRTHGRFDLHAALSACATHLISFGGHQAAAGLKISKDRIDAFRDDFFRYVSDNHTTGPRDSELQIDAEVRLADLTPRAVRELDLLSPFGADNPRPVFATTRVELAEPPRKMGQDERHLSLRVRQHNVTLRAIAFARSEWADQIAQLGGPFSISYAPCINRFRGAENVELQLIDWQPEPSVAARQPVESATV